jgi:hypothetical protein
MDSRARSHSRVSVQEDMTSFECSDDGCSGDALKEAWREDLRSVALRCAVPCDATSKLALTSLGPAYFHLLTGSEQAVDCRSKASSWWVEVETLAPGFEHDCAVSIVIFVCLPRES